MKKILSILLFVSFLIFGQAIQVSAASDATSPTYSITNSNIYDGINDAGKPVVVFTFDVNISTQDYDAIFYKDGIKVVNDLGIVGTTTIQSYYTATEGQTYYSIPAGKTGTISLMTLFDPKDMPHGSRNILVVVSSGFSTASNTTIVATSSSGLILRTLVKPVQATPAPVVAVKVNQQIGDAGGSIVVPPTSKIIDCKFDATKYANYYPDLKAAYGSNTSALTTHYIQHGLFEGRTPCGSYMPSCRFDAQTYANIYPDLKAAFGSNTSALTTHYTQHGILEGRDVCQTKVTTTPVADAAPVNTSSRMASAYESVKGVFSQVLKVLFFWR